MLTRQPFWVYGVRYGIVVFLIGNELIWGRMGLRLTRRCRNSVKVMPGLGFWICEDLLNEIGGCGARKHPNGLRKSLTKLVPQVQVFIRGNRVKAL